MHEVFAIAFALHAAMGHNISGLAFDQLKVRSHLQNFLPSCKNKNLPLFVSLVTKQEAKESLPYIWSYIWLNVKPVTNGCISNDTACCTLPSVR